MQTPRKVWIETYGCQMNINDSEKMYRLLDKLQFSPTAEPQDADLILLNTCTIREKAEHKVFSSLGRLQQFKQARPGVVIGVAGCMAQMLGEKIRKRAPYVDLVFGTYSIHKLPEMIENLDKMRQDPTLNEAGIVETGKLMPNDFDFLPLQKGDMLSPGLNNHEVAKHVTIQNGCNKNCSYCIVPTVRGRELSRPPEDILAEIRQLAQRGVREVMLVGQTVNSYGKGTEMEFPELLRAINQIDGIARIRFVTSHPRDLNDRLIAVMAECEKVCPHLHLPVQSGSDAVLRRMYRGYTFDKYVEKTDKLRAQVPGLSLTTDIIVGFPGETEEDFAATLKLMERVRFENSFSFIYSKRPFTRAAEWPDQLPNDVSKERLYRLQELQDRLTEEALANRLGTQVEVLVEGPSESDSIETGRELRGWRGRTPDNWNVHFHAPADDAPRLTGTLINVKVDRVLAHSLQGVMVC